MCEGDMSGEGGSRRVSKHWICRCWPKFDALSHVLYVEYLGTRLLSKYTYLII